VTVAALLDRLPEGWSVVRYDGRAYGVTKSHHAHGRKVTLYAEELGGVDVISANLYLTSCEQLRPCEMPAENVLTFLRQLTLDHAESSSGRGTGGGPRRPGQQP
jgi:hypothetical protein